MGIDKIIEQLIVKYNVGDYEFNGNCDICKCNVSLQISIKEFKNDRINAKITGGAGIGFDIKKGNHFEKLMCDECFESSKPEIYSRVVGYLRPIKQWNTGKRMEFENRKNFKLGE